MQKKNISVLTPEDLHKRVERRMYEETGKINFTQLVLGFFEQYAAGESVPRAREDSKSVAMSKSESKLVSEYLEFLRDAPEASRKIVLMAIGQVLEIKRMESATKVHDKNVVNR